MIRRPPRSTRTDTLFPYTTLFRSDMNRVHRLLMIGVLLLPGAWSPAMAQDQDLPSGYVSIAPLVVPVVDNFRMPAVLMTRLTIEASDPEVRQKLEIARPKLMGAYVRALMNFRSEERCVGKGGGKYV